MYRSVPRSEIVDAVVHLNELHRQIRPLNDREYRARERREAATRTLLSNLPRTQDHPTLKALLEIAEIFSLTIEGAHRLFGYELATIREYDLRLNGGRTHIVESYGFERDLLVDLPLELASEETFQVSGDLRHLVTKWQTDVPVRALDGYPWRRPGTFYVHVGTEDSLGSSLPPGSMALVEPVDDAETHRPNPRAIYLLQFGNGYRCSRCVVTHGKLHLLASERQYQAPKAFAYPGAVRVAGRIRTFALALPLPEYPQSRLFPFSEKGAELVLPWEHLSRDKLFAAEHRRFERSRDEEQSVRDTLNAALHAKLSTRTERRYRSPSNSQPHVNALIYLTVAHLARYTDALRTGGITVSDSKRFSLQVLLKSKHFEDVIAGSNKITAPTPSKVWEDRRREFVEWPLFLSLKFPHLRLWEEHVLRTTAGGTLKGLDPAIAPDSWMLLEKLHSIPDIRSDRHKTGWSRPIYVFRRGLEAVWGYLERDGNQLVLHSSDSATNVCFQHDELASLSRVAGVAVPV